MTTAKSPGLAGLKSYRRYQDKTAAYDGKKLKFGIEGQRQTNWCWAAVSVSIASYYDPHTRWTQCKVATSVTGGNCCGPGASLPPCNLPNFLEVALSMVGHHKKAIPRSASYSSLQTEIASDRPLGVRVEWPNGDGHFLAIFGWRTTSDGRKYISIGDPNKGIRQILISDLRTNYAEDGGKWTHSYYSCLASTGAKLTAPAFTSAESRGP